MKLNSLNDSGATAPLGPKKIEPSQPKIPDSQKVDQLKPPAYPTDQTEISAGAREISEIQEMVRLHREAYGDIAQPGREQKLEEVRQKMANGFYDSDEGIENLADLLVEGALGDSGKSSSIKNITRRASDGYYDRPAVIEKTAENMLKQVIPKKYQP